jgi:hypothetical protein
MSHWAGDGSTWSDRVRITVAADMADTSMVLSVLGGIVDRRPSARRSINSMLD